MSPSTSTPIDIPNRQRPSRIADDYGTGPQKSNSIIITPRHGDFRRCGGGSTSAPGLYQNTGAGLEDEELRSLDLESAPLEEAPLPLKSKPSLFISKKQEIDKSLRRMKLAKKPKLRSIEETVEEITAVEIR